MSPGWTCTTAGWYARSLPPTETLDRGRARGTMPRARRRGQEQRGSSRGADDGHACGLLLQILQKPRLTHGSPEGRERFSRRRPELNPFPALGTYCPQCRPTDELALLRRVAAKDRKAFEALYHLYYRRLFGYLLKLTRRAELVEEVLNDVMLAIWKGAGELRRPLAPLDLDLRHRLPQGAQGAGPAAGGGERTGRRAPSRSTARSRRAWRRGGSWRACWAGRSAPCRRSSGRSSS